MPQITKVFNYSGQFFSTTQVIPSGTTKLTLHLWGGAGGSGGSDSAGEGADGAAGQHVTATDIDMTSFAGTKFLGVAVGGGGEAGGSGNDTPGGKNGQSLTGYSGGIGGESGDVGSSGSGGGGGGATIVTMVELGQGADNIVLAIAGGGGGGGGTGEASRGGRGLNSNTATSNTPGTLGEDGAGHTGNGGGGGAGGGGKDGGTGGSGATGDAGGFGGKSGSNTVPSGGSEDNGSQITPGGTSNSFYETGIAKGGVAGQAGGNGKAVLIFTLEGTTNFKVDGNYKEIQEIYAKVSGVWKEIIQAYHKVSGAWKSVFIGDILFRGDSAAFGNNSGGATSGTEGSGGIPTAASIPPQDPGDSFRPPVTIYEWRPNPHTASGYSKAPPGSGGVKSAGTPKIVCTMMNDMYGFGSFRNKIWLRQSKNLPPEYQKGYHAIFLPLVKYARQPGMLSRCVRRVLEHIAVHRTIDIRQEERGKVHWKGRLYRKILEPICYYTGKIKQWKANK